MTAFYQRRLSEFLDHELHHSLGAYRVARDGLLAMQKQLRQDIDLSGKNDAAYLIELAEHMRSYNHTLDQELDADGAAFALTEPRSPGNPRERPVRRHPAPNWLPLSQPASPLTGVPEQPDATSTQALTWVTAFYAGVQHAAKSSDPDLRLLRQSVLMRRADVLRGEAADDPVWDDVHIDRKVGRHQRRLDAAHLCGIPARHFTGAEQTARTILGSYLEAPHRRPLAAFVVRALVDAHLTLHEVDAIRSSPLDGRATRDAALDQAVNRALERSVALNTFVWATCRIAPWTFAEHEAERLNVAKEYHRCWRDHVPMRTMWIGTQLSLLALQRRAAAYDRLGDRTSAFKDLYKLQRQVRDTARRLRRGTMHVHGAMEFLDTLDGLADYSMAQLYRRDADQVSGLRHFNRAYTRFERLKTTPSRGAIVNSRWSIHLQLGLGKASYDMGRHKAALRWYFLAWRSLLELIAADIDGTIIPAAVNDLVDWLTLVIDDPELHKRDLIDLIEPAVEQIEAFRVDDRFKTLASQILLHLGHLLFVLNLGEQRQPDPRRDADSAEPRDADVPEARDPETAEARDTDRGKLAPELPLQPGTDAAWRVVRRAWNLDGWNTLAAADLLKMHFRATRGGASAPAKLEQAIERIERGRPVKWQWPGGFTDDQGLSRAIEYVLLRQLRGHPTDASEEQDIAREMLHSLLTHTDSVEARKAHVFDYLSRSRASVRESENDDAAAIEFICLRRYSSAYPILPRPRSFRADGGGYFVRVHPGRSDGNALGIAVDPGTGFIDCLFRAGFSLADIDVLLVTHDHVDHASALEPLLSLRHERCVLLDEQAPLMVLSNRSIARRLSRIATYKKDDSLEIVDLSKGRQTIQRAEAILTDRLRARIRKPGPGESVEVEPRPELRLTPLSSALGGRAHPDLDETPSIGLLIELAPGLPDGETRTLAISGDLPRKPSTADWPQAWQKALRADALVCHVSTVPLTELRRMADLPKVTDPVLLGDIAFVNDAVRRGHHRRFDYAYWLRDAPPLGDDPRLTDWRAPTQHPYLLGLLRIARGFRDAGEGVDLGARQLIIGELSEELGSFRGKIGLQLNSRIFAESRCRAITADIGLRTVLSTHPDHHAVRVLCSTCDLDNDLVPAERLHPINEMFEISVKGENEGIFYNCPDHEPAGHPGDPTFIERHERYDLFGR